MYILLMLPCVGRSVALVVVLADGSADNISNVDKAKPFLAQREAVKVSRRSRGTHGG